MTFISTVRSWAKRVKRDAVTLWFAYRNPATPWLAKSICIFVVAYAFSPIDLIPDFIPVIGFLDDALLLPGLIWLAVRLLPADVLVASRLSADQWLEQRGAKPTSYVGAACVVAVWLAVAGFALWYWLGQRTAYSDMVSIGVSIPLQVAPAQRQDRETASKLALVDKAEADLAEATRVATAEYESLLGDVQRLQQRIARYQASVVVPAQQRIDAATAGYASIRRANDLNG